MQEDEPKPADSRWQVKTREVLVKNRWHEYRHDAGKTDYGSAYDYYYVYKRYGSVCIVPLTTDGKLVMVRQYRYLLNDDSFELPGGGCEEIGDPQQAAQLELLQETSYRSEHWEQIGRIGVAIGHCTDMMAVFLARDCQPGTAQALEDTERGMHVELVSVADAYRLVDEGNIIDSLTIAALGLARKHLLKP